VQEVKKNLAGRTDTVPHGSIQLKFPPTFVRKPVDSSPSLLITIHVETQVSAKDPVVSGSPIKRGAIPVEESDSDEDSAPEPTVFFDELNPGILLLRRSHSID
jgi:hypothetical protein